MTELTLGDYIARITRSEALLEKPATRPDELVRVLVTATAATLSAESPYAPSMVDAYGEWAATVWAPNQLVLDERDFTIMALGLPGEWGEVVDVLDAEVDGRTVERTMKEMGDLAYYWVRIGHAFALPFTELWGNPVIRNDAAPNLDAAIRKMTRHVGRVSEVLKKRARDGVTDLSKLSDGLKGMAEAWHQLASALRLNPHEILVLNRKKVDDRYARNVLRGSGDDR